MQKSISAIKNDYLYYNSDGTIREIVETEQGISKVNQLSILFKSECVALKKSYEAIKIIGRYKKSE